jgi:hypothetical protein
VKTRLTLLLSFAAALFSLRAQDVSATLNGTLRDGSGAVIANASVKLISNTTGATKTARTNAEGYFAFPDLQIGAYSISAEMPGFKTYRQREITLTAGQIRSLGDITMTVGDVAETVTVEALATVVELSSGEKSGVITREDLENTAIRGRDYLDMLRLLPGVVDESDGREAPGPDGIRNLYINGARENQKNITLDGVTSMDSGSNSTTHTAPTLGMIAEVKVLTSNYQAEYGRAVGGTVIVTTRAGSRQYHGSGFWNHRHEEFNANDYFNNQRGLARTPYRYNLEGWNLLGPVWPKNRTSSRFFFFVSQEFTRQKVNYPQQQVRMPTALERTGDFSQTLDTNRALLRAYDPLTATTTPTPFPNNIVPANRQDKNGQAILAALPLPNYTDPDPLRAVTYNYIAALSGSYPRRTDSIKLDYAPPSSTLQATFRYTQDADEQHPPYSVWINGGLNFPLSPLTFRQPGRGMAFAVTRPIGPSWFTETRFGYSMNRLTSFPDQPDNISKSALGINLPQWYPQFNPSGYIPNITFGTPGNAPNMSLNNAMPYKNVNHIFSLTQNLTKISGKHNVKMGLYAERTRKDQLQGTPTRGQISFSDDANNPLRTRYGFASALMGIMTTYSEATTKPYGLYRFTNLEWYVQDNWRVSRRLTLDYGLRVYHDLPQDEVRGQTAAFVQSFYSRAGAPVLITDIRNASNTRVGYNPATGQQVNLAFLGTFAPGVGDPAIAMVSAGTLGFPNSLYTIPGLMFGPRVGFAYDPFGRSRTAIRGGFGIVFDRVQGNPTMNMLSNPPTSFSPTLYYSTFGDLAASANTAVLAPSTIGDSLYGKGTAPTSYQYSLGIQHSINRNTRVEASYVGNFSRHLLWKRNINPVPVAAQFPTVHPENRDPANGNAIYASNFLRPYTGYGDIFEYEFGGTSNYNSLQTQFSTRLKGGLDIRASYTFAKALGSANSDTATVTPFFDPRTWNYGRLTFSRDHVLTFMPSWSMPRAWLPASKALRIPMQNWLVYVTAQFSTGQPYRPGLATTDGLNYTGTPSQGANLTWIGPSACSDPNNCPLANQFSRGILPRPSGSLEVPYFGNLGVNTFNRPGTNNWDARVTRRFNLFSERRTLDFRMEAFNFPNHTQFSNIDTNGRYDTTGKLANALFLTPTAARRPRVLNLGVQVNF